MKRFILPLVLTLVSTPAFAENINVYVPRADGGVTRKSGNVTVQEAAVIMGRDKAPDGATGVILERGKPPRWTNLNPSEVDKEFGGDGEAVVEVLPEDDPTVPIEIVPKEDAGDSRIKPKSGNWIGEIVEQTFEGCPAAIITGAKAQASAITTGPILGVIDASFTPVRMAPQFDWKKTGPNAWTGTLDKMTGKHGVRIQWAMQIRTSTFIESRQQLNFALGPMGSCIVYTKTDIGWIN
jgi:hypothetical protein